MDIRYTINVFLTLLVEVKNKEVRDRLYKYFFDHRIGAYIIREEDLQ